MGHGSSGSFCPGSQLFCRSSCTKDDFAVWLNYYVKIECVNHVDDHGDNCEEDDNNDTDS